MGKLEIRNGTVRDGGDGFRNAKSTKGREGRRRKKLGVERLGDPDLTRDPPGPASTGAIGIVTEYALGFGRDKIMRVQHVILLLIPALLLSGCFTALSKSAGAWSGDTSVPPQAVALDVVTAPLQAPFWILAGVGHIKSANRAEEQRKFHQSFLEDVDFRQRFIRSPDLKPHNRDFLIQEDLANTLTKEDVRDLWARFKNSATGLRCQFLIAPKNTPPEVLTEYYRTVLAQAEKREGKPSPRDLIYHERLLLHPNLPPAVIAEIQSYSVDSLEHTLNRRKP